VTRAKDQLFEACSKLLLQSLEKAANCVQESLEDELVKLAKQIEVSLSVLWMNPYDNPIDPIIRAEILEATQFVLKQVSLWMNAEQSSACM
jgi:hypothetical protein